MYIETCLRRPLKGREKVVAVARWSSYPGSVGHVTMSTCDTVNLAYKDTRRHSAAGHQKSVVIREVSLYPKSHYVLQLDGTLLWAWKLSRYSRIVVISAVVIGEVD